jgi:hypothetical protein
VAERGSTNFREPDPGIAIPSFCGGGWKMIWRSSQRHAKHTCAPIDLELSTERLQIDGLDQTINRTYEDGSFGTVDLRPNGYTFANGSANWTYDAAGRPITLGDGTDNFTYSYRYTVNSGGNHEGVTTGSAESTMPFHLDGPKIDTTLE